MTAYEGKAQDYAAYRPPYAEKAVEALCECVGLDRSWVVADIGSGTGNVSRWLVPRVRRLFAVEPDDSMRNEAERLLCGHAGFTSITGVAEATTLPEASVDMIAVGQAVHWFDVDRAHAEFDRILRPGGWVAFLWNRFGMQEDPDLSTFLCQGEYVRLSFPEILREDWKHFIGGTRSAANAPNQGDTGYDEFEYAQRIAFDARSVDGMITVQFSTELAVGRMKSRTSPLHADGDSVVLHPNN